METVQSCSGGKSQKWIYPYARVSYTATLPYAATHPIYQQQAFNL